MDFSVAAKDLDGVYASVRREVGKNFNLYGELSFERAEEGEFTAEWDGALIYVSDGKNRDLFTGFFQDIGDTLGCFAQRLSTNCPEAQANSVCRTPSFLLLLLEIGLTWTVNQSEICLIGRFGAVQRTQRS